MLSFKEITLQDKDTIVKYIINSSRRNCDLSFSNLCSWKFLYHTRFAEVDGFIVFKFWAKDNLSYMMPVGTGDIKSVLSKMMDDARQEGEKLCMLGVCANMKKELEDLFPEAFTIEPNRDFADYLYLRTDLATLTGKKFQPKRNHINKFRKNYNYEYAAITPELIPECLRLEAEWCKQNNCNQQEGTGNESQAVIYALTHFKEIGLTGGLLRVDGQIVAFTFGMPINYDTFGVHVEKADIRYEGVYATINYEFANRIPEQFTYINREEDLGIEGLRKAKLSYQPVIILEKSMACLKKKTQ